MLQLDGDRLSLVDATEVASDVWPLADMRRIKPDVFTVTFRPGARLVVSDAELANTLAMATPRFEPPSTRAGTWMAISIAGAVIAVLVAIMLIPPVTAAVGRMIPASSERAVGRYITQELMGDVPRCTAPAGVAALARLSDKLHRASGLVEAVQVEVRDRKQLNAFAAPGGQIVILRGVLDAAGSVEEVAAVLGHEIGHVMHGDPRDQMVRIASLLFLGQIISSEASSVALLGLGMTYGREAERRADRSSLDLLRASGISLRGMSAFFAHVEAEEKDHAPARYISTHPPTAERRREAERAAQDDPNRDAAPFLSPAEWQALKGICAQTAASTSR